MSKVFVSYARDGRVGESLAAEVQQKLQNKGYEVFRDLLDLKPGDAWYSKLEFELETSDLVILVLSEKARISKWVNNEVSMAEEIGLPIIPVLAEQTRTPLWLRHLQHLDFSKSHDWDRLLESVHHYLGPDKHLQEPEPEPEPEPEKKRKAYSYTSFSERVERALKVFISYSHKDKQLKESFFDHISPLVRVDKVTVWNDSAIDVGSDWYDEIIGSLKEADLVVCLVSSSFIASDFCYLEEFTEALEAHREGTKKVIPVRVRQCFWDPLPIAKIQSAPSNWITSSDNQDEAWTEVIQRISEYIEKENMRKKQEYDARHNVFKKQGRESEKL